MKLSQETSPTTNTITAHGDGYVDINLQRHTGSVIVAPEGPVRAWPVEAFESLTPELFEMLADGAPEVVLLGTGSKIRFPHPRLTAALMKRGIGVEAMDSGAACRTYNILMQEDRRVVAAILVEAS
ncbi:Mth938-like domain-containing protein [Pararobbsia silviterrae]|uniref:Mth938-like domain-containing protein n=1 Tax=Pararobbsia silviterrae TaxID=1792498 RepID=UPI001F0BA1AF|nr:Mth938-like domain-containing protein [Pararobbsia silviterrae]